MGSVLDIRMYLTVLKTLLILFLKCIALVA